LFDPSTIDGDAVMIAPLRQAVLGICSSLSRVGPPFRAAFAWRHIRAPMISMNTLTTRANTINSHHGTSSRPRNIIVPISKEPRPPAKPSHPRHP
jgi:hypothetical protein